MIACATQENIVEKVSVGNLFLLAPDTDFRDFLEEVEELAKFAPEIIKTIEKDLDANAKKKKKIRLADKKFFKSLTRELPNLSIWIERFSAGMGYTLAGGNGQVGISDLSCGGQTQVKRQAEETLSAIIEAWSKGCKLFGRGIEMV